MENLGTGPQKVSAALAQSFLPRFAASVHAPWLICGAATIVAYGMMGPVAPSCTRFLPAAQLRGAQTVISLEQLDLPPSLPDQMSSSAASRSLNEWKCGDFLRNAGACPSHVCVGGD